MNKTYYRFSSSLTANVAPGMDTEVLCALWHGFSFRCGQLKTVLGEADRISIGNATYLPMTDGDEYTVCIREDGIGISARDEKTLFRAFAALLMRIENMPGEKDTFRIECGDIHGDFNISTRMIHLCVFPETSLSMLQRLVRLCGICSYTHVVLEFWGMIKYDCLDALAWPNAFSKEEIRPIIREARAMGVELIPMINHLGHAAFCRIDCGKHVVLDQDPSLQYLFTPDGWCWDITQPAVRALLREMRRELCELFGEGEYFHIGCDEAHIYSSEYYPLEALSGYLHDLSAEVISEGRRPILWGDMIVPYDTNSDDPAKVAAAAKQAERMRPILSALHPRSLIADWHYDIKRAPVPSISEFQKAGFDVVGCPWDNHANIDAQHQTAVELSTFGLMMTTWHTLHSGMNSILYFARKCGLPKVSWSDYAGHRNLEIAVLLRKLTPSALPYADCGFCARQTEDIYDW